MRFVVAKLGHWDVTCQCTSAVECGADTRSGLCWDYWPAVTASLSDRLTPESESSGALLIYLVNLSVAGSHSLAPGLLNVREGTRHWQTMATGASARVWTIQVVTSARLGPSAQTGTGRPSVCWILRRLCTEGAPSQAGRLEGPCEFGAHSPRRMMPIVLACRCK